MTSRTPAPADQPVLVNHTGLTLSVSITEGGQTTTVPVEPLGSAGHSLRSGTGAEVTVTDAASGRLILQTSADPEQLPVLLTPAQLAPAESSAAAAVPVEFRNDSGEYADLCRVERTGEEILLAPAVPPAATARVQPSPGEVLVARSCFDELLLGTWFADAQAGPLVAGPGLREAAVRVLPPSPYPGITKLELVSQPRPEPDPAASQFVQVSSQDNGVLRPFNGRSDVLTRDVTIVGVELLWSRARTQHVTRDYGHATAVAHDIEHLMIHADRVVISCPLFFPGTDVTIHARVLEFTGDGCLNTTPRPHLQARATPANPSKDRPVGYKAADGLGGQRAGSVTLRVGSVHAPAGAVVIRAGGSAGQAAEAGGWLDYTKRGAGQPEPLKNSAEPPAYAPLTMKAIEDVFASYYGGFLGVGYLRALSSWDWPSPGQYANIERDGRWPLAEGRVVSCSIIAWRTAAGNATVDVFKFVNNVGERIYHASNEFNTENPDPQTLVTWPEVAKGRDAYPGGQPGTGGAGGTVRCSVPLAPEHCDLQGGPAGHKSDEVPGGPPGNPQEPYHLALVIDDPIKAVFWGKKYPEVQPATGPMKAERGASAGEVTAQPGGPGEILSADGASWLSGYLVDSCLAFASAAFRNGHREAAGRVLGPLWAQMRNHTQLPAELALRYPTLASLRANLLANLDFYGNPPGWLPRLSLASNLDVFEAVEDSTLSMLYYAGSMLANYDKLQHRMDIAAETTKVTAGQLQRSTDALVTAAEDLEKARTEMDKLGAQLAGIDDQIRALRTWSVEASKESVRRQRLFSGTVKIVGGLLQVAPVGQPFLGMAGSVVGAVGEFNWNATDGFGASVTATTAAIGAKVDTALSQSDRIAGAVTAPTRQRQQQLTKDMRAIKDKTAQLTASTEDLEGKASQLQAEVAAPVAQDVADQRAKLLENTKKYAEDLSFSTGLRAALKDLEVLTGDKASARELLLARRADEKALAQLDEALAANNAAEWAKPENAEKKQKLDDVRAQLLQDRKKLKDLPGQLKAVEKDNLALTEARTQQEAATKELLGRFAGLGAGITSIGAGVGKIMTEVSGTDPEVLKLADELLANDPERRMQYRQLMFDATEAGASQQQTMQAFEQSRQALSTHLAAATQDMIALDALARQRQSASPGLDLAAKTALTDMKIRAVTTLNWAIYNMAMAYRYEFLQDVTSGFFDVTTLQDQLLRLTAATKDGADIWDLSEPEFRKTCKTATSNELFRMAEALVDQRQHVARERVEGSFSISLRPDDLDALHQHGTVSIDVVGGYPTAVRPSTPDLRLANIKAAQVKLEPTDPSPYFSLAMRIEHSGTSVLWDGKRWLYFAQGPSDKPRSWGFVITRTLRTGADGKPVIDQQTTAEVPTTAQAAILSRLLTRGTSTGSTAALKFSEYEPGFYGPLTITLDPDNRRPWDPDALAALTEVVLTFNYTHS